MMDKKVYWGTEIRILTDDEDWGAAVNVNKQWWDEYCSTVRKLQKMHDEVGNKNVPANRSRT